MMSQKTCSHSHICSGKVEKLLGNSEDVEVRTKAILAEQDIDDGDFPDVVVSSLPSAPFAIPQEEREKRRDFSKSCVFTIDPMTARYEKSLT